MPGVLQNFKPDLVLYDAGVDPHHDDKLGRLKLTDHGLMRRELQVRLTFCRAGFVPTVQTMHVGFDMVESFSSCMKYASQSGFHLAVQNVCIHACDKLLMTANSLQMSSGCKIC